MRFGKELVGRLEAFQQCERSLIEANAGLKEDVRYAIENMISGLRGYLEGEVEDSSDSSTREWREWRLGTDEGCTVFLFEEWRVLIFYTGKYRCGDS